MMLIMWVVLANVKGRFQEKNWGAGHIMKMQSSITVTVNAYLFFKHVFIMQLSCLL